MNAQGTVCQICGKVINLQNPGAGDFCQGHEQAQAGSSLKNQLDAIPTPGGGGGPQANLTQSGELKKQLDAIPAPSSDEQTIPPDSQESGKLQSHVNARPGAPAPQGGSPWGAPKGHQPQAQAQAPAPAPAAAPGDFKSQLDAIPTPGGGGAPAPSAPPQPAPNANDFKSQLDSIPTPGGGGTLQAPQQPAAAPPSPAPHASPAANISELDAIPTPGGQLAPQAPQPQAPQPQAQPPQPAPAAPPAPAVPAAPSAPAGGEEDWKSQLDAIPTPKGLDGGGAPQPAAPQPMVGAGAPAGMGASPAGGMGANPASGMASDPSAMFAGGQSNQNSSDYARSKEFSSVDASSGYTMIFVVLIVIVLGVFGFMMMNPNKKPDFSSVPAQPTTTTTTTTGTTTAPTTGTPAAAPTTTPAP